ncbi:BQ2448_7246 [Microbotryum intermedium]|uniref:BQ2448_7246 protein n=1 Tax=Microbotryum intermedium TaxID=269621 RepID=A0A238FHM5_9BASI|nr:BQ2448_7246 [Microbotryum intermedium]
MSSPRNISSSSAGRAAGGRGVAQAGGRESSTSSAQASPSLHPTTAHINTLYGSAGGIPQIPSRSELNSQHNSPRVSSPFLNPRSAAGPGPAPASGGGAVSPSLSASNVAMSPLPPASIMSSTTTSSNPNLTEAQKAEIVRRHLLNAHDQGRVEHRPAIHPRASSNSLVASSSTSIVEGPSVDDGEYPTPYHLQGGDVVAGVYKWAAQQAEGAGGDDSAAPSLRRSKSFVSLDHAARQHAAAADESLTLERTLTSNTGADDDDPSSASAMRVREILEPGGFRRDFVIRKIAEQRGEDIQVAARRVSQSTGGSRSFIDFLSLYGHFGGEDLEEIEEEDEEDEEDEIEYDGQIRGEGIPPFRGHASGSSGVAPNERTPLVRNKSTRQGTSSAAKRQGPSQGDATVTQAVLMLLKSFVGTGVLFLGKAFYNGGILFSTIVLCFIAMVSLYSFLLLVETRLVVNASFGDIGGILYGKYMRWAILFSIVLSQIGFVAAYTIFVSQNLQAFIMAVTNCRHLIPVQYLILAQLIIFLPLAMIRNIQKLSGTALIADAFILFGLVYIFSNEIKLLVEDGIADVALFNRKDFPLLIGTAVFSFEGIGLVIPITESMKDPHRFPAVLTGVMIGVMILFAGGGLLAYAAYGSAIQTVVFVNLPQDDKFVNAAQFLYSIAILLSTPLQLFPAVRIMENGLFSRSGKHSNRVKWTKNSFRMAVVVGCSAVAWAGAKDLDKFVSLVGSLACVPLCFCYPAMLHWKACAHTRKQKVIDALLFIFGLFATCYTTSQTVRDEGLSCGIFAFADQY